MACSKNEFHFKENASDSDWDSEDDPERLWCICNKPHNNKFMISCDICKDWFHGQCVGITKKMGQDLEEGINCATFYSMTNLKN
jgi:hypothetical protein